MNHLIDHHIEASKRLLEKAKQATPPNLPPTDDPLYCKHIFEYDAKPSKLDEQKYNDYLSSFIYYLWHVAQLPNEDYVVDFDYMDKNKAQELLVQQSLLGRWVVHCDYAWADQTKCYLLQFVHNTAHQALFADLLTDVIQRITTQPIEKASSALRTLAKTVGDQQDVPGNALLSAWLAGKTIDASKHTKTATLIETTLNCFAAKIDDLSTLLQYLYGKDPVKATLQQSAGVLTNEQFSVFYAKQPLPTTLAALAPEALLAHIKTLSTLVIESQRKCVYGTVDLRKLACYNPIKAADKALSLVYFLLSIALRPIFRNARGDVKLTYSYKFKDMSPDEFPANPIGTLIIVGQCLLARALPLSNADYQFAIEWLMKDWNKEYDSDLLAKLLKKIHKQLAKNTLEPGLADVLEQLSQLPHSDYRLPELSDKTITEYLQSSGKTAPTEVTIVDRILAIEKAITTTAQQLSDKECHYQRPPSDFALPTIRYLFDSTGIEDIPLEKNEEVIQGILHLSWLLELACYNVNVRKHTEWWRDDLQVQRQFFIHLLWIALASTPTLSTATLAYLIDWLLARRRPTLSQYPSPWLYYHLSQCANVKEQALLKGRLPQLCKAIADGTIHDQKPALDKEHQTTVKKHLSPVKIDGFRKLLGQQPEVAISIPIDLGEAWSDALFQTIGQLPTEQQQAWLALLQHCLAKATQPSKRWSTTATKLQENIQEFGKIALDCLSRYAEKRNQALHVEEEDYFTSQEWASSDHNTLMLKGLCWCCGLHAFSGADILLRNIAKQGYKKVYGIGMRNARVANGAIVGLGLMPGLIGIKHIVLLRASIKYNPALKNIHRLLDKEAKNRKLSAQQLEELAAPDYPIDAAGHYKQQFGEFEAQLSLPTLGTTRTLWQHNNGKIQKTVPKAVRDQFPHELKQFKQLAKDITTALIAERNRIEAAYVPERSWDIAEWQQNYLGNSLRAIISRRLIWVLSHNKQAVAAIPLAGGWVDQHDHPVEVTQYSQIRLWHPTDTHDAQVVLAWRQLLQAKRITQPFKQAHRELYLITEAELETATASNRFADNVVRHHQFHALVESRNWQHTLQGSWDGGDETDAYFGISQHNLFIVLETSPIEGVATGSGIWEFLLIGQVKAFKNRNFGEQSIPLKEIPTRIFSEIMRDVDLFTSVPNVGTAAEWEALGLADDYHHYWQDASFGPLGNTAQTRKLVLQDLLPMLDIAKQCRLEDRFLIVTGTKHEYKIHLGSSNILMSPNDQYLCIVKDPKKKPENLFLPFEGDGILSLVLSKAFLLAKDNKIRDSVMVSQIG